MTIDIDAIRRREQAATPGPWATGAGEAWSDALAPWALVINANYPLIELQEGAQGVSDANFIAHARTDIPALLAEIERLRQSFKCAHEDRLARALERDQTIDEREHLKAELDRVRADLAAAHNNAHRQDTNLQQIARAKDELAAERDALVHALADCVVKATPYGIQDGDFVANYIMPTGPIHRAIPLLQDRHGITVRPGFDGRTQPTAAAESGVSR